MAGNNIPCNQLVAALALALDIEEEVKLYHAWRVAAGAQAAAAELHPDDRAQQALVFYAGLLHDVGAVGLSDHIVHLVSQPDYLAIPGVQEHPTIGSAILRTLPQADALATAVADHHERLDGHGYPQGKVGEELSLSAQLLHVADLADIHFRLASPWDWQKILKGLKKGAGKAFLPQAFEAFQAAMEQGLKEVWADSSAVEAWVRQLADRLPLPLPPSCSVSAVLEVFARIIDAKHAYTAGHSQRVANYAQSIARAAGLGPSEVTAIYWSGLLHDLGKISVPRAILDKPGRLNQEELVAIRNHPIYTGELLREISGLKEISEIASGHHERFDGQGYPQGLRADGIPLGARVLALADAFDAMTSPRPYQQRRSPEEALKELQRGSGTQFDPDLVPVATAALL
ncbi:MAG: HD domain-containing protein [Clostridia bacterium]|nr:HD domain-containing protein [Clostridia bacterium]